jgi:hypothetical protein
VEKGFCPDGGAVREENENVFSTETKLELQLSQK